MSAQRDPIHGLICDPIFEEHETGPGHPEKPERLARCRAAIDATKLPADVRRMPIVPATDAMLQRVHDPFYVERIDRAWDEGRRTLDAEDTAIGPRSAEVARLAAGSVSLLALAVARNELATGFAAVRPPGHHAERAIAMGFCLFNNVAVAAQHVRAETGLDRVLIVDWDVHHGNGTQHIFEEDPDVFYFSCHQSPLYPGTGARDEIGTGAGRGATLNCPLPPGVGDDAFLGTLRDELSPAAAKFRPDLVMISAGFDAHRADPLASLDVTTEAYGEATRILKRIAADSAGGRIVSLLEGGYDLDALSASLVTHLSVLFDVEQELPGA